MEPYKNLPYNRFMDMKKKLEDAYNSDKKSQKEKLVFGLSGGIDSLVTAYLLKIQKYDLIAVTIQNSWDEYPADQSEILSCHNNQAKIESLKEFCTKLGIPLHVVKSTAEFKESVIEPWLSEKMIGQFPKQCWNCHELRMTLLYNKMRELGAKHMATGHYAKIFHHESHGTVFVHTSNDEQNDQSQLLSRLPHDVLNSLILPLSDLTKKEVLKLAENFGLVEGHKTLEMHKCLGWNEEIAKLFEKKVPKKFLKEGEITLPDGMQKVGEHTGVQSHTPGEIIEYRDAGKTMKGYFGEFSYSDKRMVVVDEAYFMHKKCLITKCRFSEEVSWVEPFKGYVILSGDRYVDCWIYPKPLHTVYVELMEDQRLMSGEMVTVVKKKGKNSKIYLTGELLLLEKEITEENEEGEVRVPKVNHAIDF